MKTENGFSVSQAFWIAPTDGVAPIFFIFFVFSRQKLRKTDVFGQKTRFSQKKTN
jgi:hypothetical protein